MSRIQPIGNRPYAAPISAARTAIPAGIPIATTATAIDAASPATAAHSARTRRDANSPSSSTTGASATSVERICDPNGS